MLIVYDSMTGNCRRFVNKLPYKHCHINDYDGASPFILVTYTINFGNTPKTTEEFMEKHHKNCLAVSSSGHVNWGAYFGKAADNLNEQYGIPILMKFQQAGRNYDVDNFIEKVETYEQMARTQR